MRAIVCHDGQLHLDEVADRRPGRGQVLLDVVRCGICGSDLHARQHADEQADALAEVGYRSAMRAEQRVVMGHEFAGAVADYGPGCRGKLPVGSVVVALPLLRTAGGLDAIGLSAAAPGGYAEQVVVQESLMLPVPNGLPAATAALTEPMAIGRHAVLRAELGKRDLAVVLGCGPVGLAVICMLKAEGVRHVVASDFSPTRRELARACGADIVVDPAADSPYTAAGDRGHVPSVPAAAELGVGTVEKLRRLPLPWHVVWRVAERLGMAPQRPVIFECVGVPGMLDSVITAAPMWARIVVVGVCMTPDTIRPVIAINKEVDLRFVVGYTPLEFRDTLHLLADGTIDPTRIVTDTVALDAVPAAFDALTHPGAQAKILIDPAAPH